MNRARMLRTIILPLLIAAMATVGLYQALSGRAVKPAGPSVDTVRVVVASRDIPSRTLITADMVALREVPAAYVLAGTVRTLDASVGRVTLVPLAPGEILLSSKITTQQPGAAGLSFVIPPGKRALTVQVDEISGVAAFPRPGDSVDIMVTFLQAPQPGTAPDQRTRLLMENVSILAVVQDTSVAEAAPRELRGYTSLTLEVTPEQGAIITAAEAQGLLRFLLRPALDSATVGGFDISGSSLMQSLHTLNTNLERRIGFNIRMMEVDVGALAGQGHGTYGASISSLSVEEVGMLLNLINQGQAGVLKSTTTSTSNRTAVSISFGGEAGDDAALTSQRAPYGLEIQATPSYYGQPFVSVDTKITLRIVDLGVSGVPTTSIITAGAAERLAAGEGLMVVGLAAAEDFAPRTDQQRFVLPAECVTPQLVTGERTLVILITPSF